MRIAILDLGTNTFNLLIIETIYEGNPKIIFSGKEPVKLGEDGITKGFISEKAFERGMAALEKHKKIIKDHGAGQVYAFATSAIRSAENGLEFVRKVYQKFNIGIKIITGDKEAELIYQGVRQAVKMDNKKHLILDIGGGSNELIIADNYRIYWKESYPLGMARLLEQFRPSDPINEGGIIELENHFLRSMEGFMVAAVEHQPDTLIGSSGSFDTFRALLISMKGRQEEEYHYQGDPGNIPYPDPQFPFSPDNGNPGQNTFSADVLTGQAPNPPSYLIEPDDFFRLHHKLIRSNSKERSLMRGMDPMRIEMIVIAGVFVNFIVRRLNISSIIQSDFALKEGAVTEVLNYYVTSG